MTRRLHLALLACAAALACTAALRELRNWRADQLAYSRSPETLRAALALSPEDATKWRQLGIALLDKDPGAAASAFRQATELNSYETDALLGLALHAESRGDTAGAESLYLRAIARSKRFRPRYALAAFYARQGKMKEFWPTAASAAQIDKADIRRIVQLAQQAGGDPDQIPQLLDLRTSHALASYMRVALAENRIVPLAESALRLTPAPEHQSVLLAACDRLIQAGAADKAITIWNRLRPGDKLDPNRGASLTRFAQDEPARAFAWRYPRPRGVQITHNTAGGLRIELSGDQPQYAVLIEQTAPVLPARQYRLAIDSDAAALPSTAGLQWHAECLLSRDILASALVPASTEGSQATFFTPGACELARISLTYKRQPGTVRIAGTLELRSARLELLP